jgi:hypothetical protein
MPSVGEFVPADRGTATNTGTSTVAGSPGLVTRTGSTAAHNNSLSWPSNTRFDLPSTGFTMGLVVRGVVAAGSSYDRMFHRNIDAGPAANSYGFLRTSNADKAGMPYGYIGTNVGYVTGRPGLSLVDYERLIITHNGTDCSFWRNGVLIETITRAVPFSSSLTMRLGAGTSGGVGDEGAPIDVEMAFLLNRGWSALEIVDWSSNRYKIFAEPQWLYTGMGSGSWTPLEVTG